MTRPAGARWSSPGRISPSHTRSVTSSTAPRRLDTVSSGPMTRNVSRFRATTSRSQPPITRVGSELDPPGRVTGTA
jgi:hypothetical protein